MKVLIFMLLGLTDEAHGFSLVGTTVITKRMGHPARIFTSVTRARSEPLHPERAAPTMLALGHKVMLASTITVSSASWLYAKITRELKKREEQFRDLAILCEQEPSLEECRLIAFQAKGYSNLSWWRILMDPNVTRLLESASTLRRLSGY